MRKFLNRSIIVAFTFTCSVIAVLHIPLEAKAELVNVQFGGATNYVGKGVIGGSTDFWNQSENAVQRLSLMDSGGNTDSGVVVYWSEDIANIGNTSNGFEHQTQENLMAGYIYTSDTTVYSDTGIVTNKIKFSGLSINTQYDLYVYTQGEKEISGQQLTISGDQLTALGGGHSITSSASVGSTDHFILGQNYLTMKATTDANGDLLINYSNAVGRGVINAIQLSSAVPEPSTIVLMGLGGLLLIVRLRKSALFPALSEVAA